VKFPAKLGRIASRDRESMFAVIATRWLAMTVLDARATQYSRVVSDRTEKAAAYWIPACAEWMELTLHFLQCNKIRKTAPANGQWRFGRLLCNGAAGIQASGPNCSVPKKNTREETCID